MRSFSSLLILLLSTGAMVPVGEAVKPSPPPGGMSAEAARIARFADSVARNRQGFWEARLVGGIEMVYVPEGVFPMGSPRLEAGREPGEGPVHLVRLKGVWIGKYEVTRGLWATVMGGGPPGARERDLPRAGVSWWDVQTFLRRLQEKTSLAFRLPTEAEWERSCRGNSLGPQYGPLDGIAWHSGNSGGRPHPVGTRAANGFGLFDMLGNVWEWCSDWYGNGYYAVSVYADPSGPERGKRRVVRGGGFLHAGAYLRCAHRNDNDPFARSPHLGFRLALDAVLKGK